MFRKLTALEIAEGALLADVAVVFQLLTLYLPIGGDFFRILIFVVFAILVLRRGLYVGVMGMLVALFITVIVTGPQPVITLALEVVGGLFLGFTMKRRLPHILLLLIGITGGAIALYILLFLSFLLVGLPLTTLVRGLHNAYNSALALIGVLSGSIGLGNQWRQTLLPSITPLAVLGFKYWFILYYVALWVLLCPFVVAIYAVTNLLVRRLGYTVPPFPGGWLNKRLRHLSRSLLKYGIRHGMIRRPGAAKAWNH